MTKDDGGPAFPEPTGSNGGIFQTGMTLWDYYFSHAMCGLLNGITEGVDWGADPKPESIAADIADAMIAERNRRFKGRD